MRPLLLQGRTAALDDWAAGGASLAMTLPCDPQIICMRPLLLQGRPAALDDWEAGGASPALTLPSDPQIICMRPLLLHGRPAALNDWAAGGDYRLMLALGSLRLIDGFLALSCLHLINSRFAFALDFFQLVKCPLALTLGCLRIVDCLLTLGRASSDACLGCMFDRLFLSSSHLSLTLNILVGLPVLRLAIFALISSNLAHLQGLQKVY
jgi:hypothetical protein